MHTEVETLTSGSKLLLTPIDDSNSITLLCAVPVGSRHENPAEAGLAHFFEHMVFKGGQKYRTAQSISETLDGCGAKFNAFTDTEVTAYYIKIAACYAEVAIDVLSDIVLHARFPMAETEREKGVVLEEYKMYWDMPDARADMQIGPLIFGSAAVGRPVIGIPQTIKTFTPADLRRWRRHYGAERFVISAAGQLPRGFSKKIAQSFGGLPPADQLPADQLQIWSDGPRWHMDARPGEQTQLVMGWPSLSLTDERRWAMRLLRTILGGYASSRLFTEIREKRGLCYTIRAVEQSYVDTGIFGVTAGLDASRLTEALTAIWQEVGRLSERLVGEAELTRAREYLKGSMAIDLEGSYSQAWWRAEQWLTDGKLMSFDQINERLSAVRPADIRSLARDFLHANGLGLVLVGPDTSLDKLKSIIV